MISILSPAPAGFPMETRGGDVTDVVLLHMPTGGPYRAVRPLPARAGELPKGTRLHGRATPASGAHGSVPSSALN
jgi:hypothetical protein